MSSALKPVPKHRTPSSGRPSRSDRRGGLRSTLALSSLAVVATGLAVGVGAVATSGEAPPAEAAQLASATGVLGSTGTTETGTDTSAAAERTEVVSRSDRRRKADPLKSTTLALDGGNNAMSQTEDLSDEDPRLIARALFAEFGFASSQFGCLDSLWERESHWNPLAANPSSGAYGIPQSLPGSKMATVAPDWRTNPITQIRWGLGYIQARYGTPCGAWGHSESHGWY